MPKGKEVRKIKKVVSDYAARHEDAPVKHSSANGIAAFLLDMARDSDTPLMFHVPA